MGSALVRPTGESVWPIHTGNHQPVVILCPMLLWGMTNWAKSFTLSTLVTSRVLSVSRDQLPSYEVNTTLPAWFLPNWLI